MADMSETRGSTLKTLFENPTSAYRGKPFWALNGKLEERELRRQIRVFKKMGLGGAFLHSRVGMATPYLSKEWFKLMNASADECRKLGMEAWLYDEDRWPSGAAGGLVTKEERYRMRFLEMQVGIPGMYFPDGADLALFHAEISDRRITSMRQLGRRDLLGLKGGGVVLAFRAVVDQPSPWFNDQAYLDTLSPEAVAKFIEVTHEAYGANMGDEFGGAVPGIFTDEPNYGHGIRPGRIPWTDKLPEVFRKRYGYDLMDRLPELFMVAGDDEYSKVRTDYRDCLTHLFVGSFSKLVGEWCDLNNMLFTGHVLAEETLRSQTREVGTAMRFYEHMQAPGIDILCGQILERQGGKPPEFATAKQCSSMLRQCGRDWMLSELYGCTGWQFTFAEHKAVGDWQAALGVNLRCQHLAYYTMRGEAKRDYPASISFQSPWCKDYPLVEDYFARLGVVLTQGHPIRDVAVIHPIESAWGYFTGGPEEKFGRLEKRFDALQNVLLGEHYDFDFVDEDFLARRGGPEGDTLKVGEAVYWVVIVPELATLRASTLGKLKEFASAGGSVVFVGEPAGRVDGEESEAVRDLARDCVRVDSAEDVPERLYSLKNRVRRVSIAGADGKEYRPSLYMLRRDPDSGRTFLFVCHTKQSASSGPLTIRIPAAGQAQEWDAVTGEVFLAGAQQEGEELLVKTELEGSQSKLYVIDPVAEDGLKPRPELRQVRKQELPLRFLDYKLDEPNAVPLDTPEYAIDSKWQGKKEILFVDRAVRDELGIRHRGGAMVQPWVGREKPKGGKKAVRVQLRYTFRIDKLPSGPCHLVLEGRKDFSVKLNGKKVSTRRNEGYWIDPAFERVTLPGKLLHEGVNELVLATRYSGGAGLECVYLTGRFGLKWDNREAVITGLPKKIEIGDWRRDGLPCYSGAVTYMEQMSLSPQAGERVFVELPKWEGTLVRVAVNGKPAGKLGWPPYEVDITDCLSGKEQDRLEITVVSSRRNLLGPLHNSEVYPQWTGPWQFVDTGKWTDEYVSVPYGLMETPVISYRAP